MVDEIQPPAEQVGHQSSTKAISPKIFTEVRIREWTMVIATVFAGAGAFGAMWAAYSTDTTLKQQLEVMKKQYAAIVEGGEQQERQIKALELQAKAADLQTTLSDKLLKVSEQSSGTIAEQAKAAKQAADAAIKSNDEAVNQYVASHRARLDPGGTGVASLALGKTILVGTKMINSGSEPAINVQKNFHFESVNSKNFTAEMLFAEAQRLCTPLKRGGPGKIVPAGNAMTFNTDREWDSGLKAAADGKDILVLFGCILYDSGSNHHRSTLCYYRDPYAMKNDYLTPCDGGFSSD